MVPWQPSVLACPVRSARVGQHNRGPLRDRLPRVRRRSEPGLVGDLRRTAQDPGHLRHEGGGGGRAYGSHRHADALTATGPPVPGAPRSETLVRVLALVCATVEQVALT